MRVLEKGELEVRCPNDHTKFAFTVEDCFVRGVIVGMIHSGQFDREQRVFVRCPACKKRIDVTGRVSYEAAKGNADALCKCPGGRCHCED